MIVAPMADAAIDRVHFLLVSPNLIDLILVVTLIEAIILVLWRRPPQHGLSRIAVGWMLLPGVFLLLAIRAALSDAAWPWVPIALTASLITHLLDLRARWRR